MNSELVWFIVWASSVIIMGICLANIITHDDNPYGKSSRFYIFVNVLGFLCVVLTFGIPAFIFIDQGFGQTVTEQQTLTIISANNRDQISGQFSLGSGIIEDNEYIFTFSKHSDGSINRIKIPMDNTTIHYDTTSPRIVKTLSYRKSLIINNKNHYGELTLKYDLYVPENSVVEKFKLE